MLAMKVYPGTITSSPGPDAEAAQGDQQGARARVDGHAITHPGEPGHLLLQLIDLGLKGRIV